MGVQIRFLRDEYAAQTIVLAYDLVGQNPIVEKAARPGKGRKLQGLKSELQASIGGQWLSQIVEKSFTYAYLVKRRMDRVLFTPVGAGCASRDTDDEEETANRQRPGYSLFAGAADGICVRCWRLWAITAPRRRSPAE